MAASFFATLERVPLSALKHPKLSCAERIGERPHQRSLGGLSTLIDVDRKQSK